MAIIRNGIQGGFSGTSGKLVGYYLRGQWVVRSLPQDNSKNKKGSAAQRLCRAKFTTVERFLFHIADFIDYGFGSEARERNILAHNAAKSHNMKAFTADHQFDYAQAKISYGHLPGLPEPKIESEAEGFRLRWKPECQAETEQSQPSVHDQVMIAAYDDGKGEKDKNNKVFGIRTGAKRQKGTDFLPIPDNRKGHTFHIWVAFVSDDRKQVSSSQYLGTYVF